MAKYGFPFLILTLFVVMAGPFMTDYVGDAVNAAAAQTGATIAAQR